MSSDLTFNKIAGAGLATVFAIVGLSELAAIVYQTPEAAKPGYVIAVQAAPAAGDAAAAPEAPPDWGTVLPAANVQTGMMVAQKCQSCHNLEKGGPNLTGPNLYGVLGRQPGTHAGFAYSPAMIAFGMKQATWDYDHINQFLSGPQAYISGTKMSFVGLKKQDDRTNVIAYLRTLNDSPPPIPAPNPAAAAAPAAAASDAAPASDTPASSTPGG